MAERFSATVERWANQTRDDLAEVFRLAVQFLLEEIEDRTPVDTGFLRASLKASKTGFAPLVDGRGILGGTYTTDDYILTISTAELGDTIYANFTANYAVYVEDGARGRAPVGMVKLSVQNWGQHVARAANIVRNRA